MRMRTLLTATSTALVLLAAPVLADDPLSGFHLSDLPYPGLALTATLANGDILAFDGATVDRFDEQGTYLTTLATFTPPVWGSFLVVDPTESIVLVGESTNGGIHRVDLNAGGAVAVATLVNNFDAAFEDPTHALVSAATCGWGCGNEVHRVDIVTGATTLLAVVPGASGPVAVGTAGELLYGTVSDSFPPPPGASDVLSWTAAQLTGNPVVTDADATLVGSGYEALGALAVDAADGRLYAAENDFGTGLNRVRLVESSASTAPVLVEGTPGHWISNLEFFPGDGVARFRAYQPPAGGRLLFDTTDFASLWERLELTPLRPSLLLSGPGTQGAGTVDVDLVAGAPNGRAWALYGPTALFDPNELAIYIAAQDLNLFLGLDPLTLTLHPVPMVLDGQGDGTLTFVHDGSLLGVLAIQAFVTDVQGRISSISSAAFL